MNIKHTIPVICIFLFSCNQAGKTPNEKDNLVKNERSDQIEHSSFFPVTDFIKGQIGEIRTKAVNPIKITTKGGNLDSVWLKMEDLDKEFAPFLSPIIDSNSLSGMFIEKKFLDQTINAFTFTYDPIKALPDSFSLQRWDVYVDPETETVRRIYLLKKTTDHKTLQLTWQSNQTCKMVYISTDPKGNDYIEQEISIKWNF